MKVKNILIAWDIWAALIITVVLRLLSPCYLPLGIVKVLSAVATSILSIIFSVYFAALAIIITSGDNKFVLFLEEEGHYTAIVGTYKFTLILLFVSLVTAIFMFGLATIAIDRHYVLINAWPVLLSALLFLYSIFAVGNSAIEAITYSKFRVDFLNITRERN